MPGKLTVIGVGPGDPELLTLKGLRILKAASCIFVPKGREEGSSLALSIVSNLLDLSGKEIVEAYFPMQKTRGSAEPGDLDAQWQKTVDNVTSRLDSNIDVVFITIGDPTVYSTFYYLHERLLNLNPDIKIEIVPGVSSIMASAARAGIYLGIADERIAVLPANYMSDLSDTLLKFDTVVLMKVNKVFNQIRQKLDEMQLTDKAAYIVRTGMEDEKIFRSLKDVTDIDLNYFSMVIVKNEKNK
ncbi:MAG: precorrin-2 C(20)-methyltransferase [Nitrospirae bacterium]|nr:precorrin-2 C(20)-methyltransferase [Nitrospirota bacterium]